MKGIWVGLLSLSVSLKYLGQVNINSRNFIALSREQSSERGRPGVSPGYVTLGGIFNPLQLPFPHLQNDNCTIGLRRQL